MRSCQFILGVNSRFHIFKYIRIINYISIKNYKYILIFFINILILKSCIKQSNYIQYFLSTAKFYEFSLAFLPYVIQV